MYARVYVHRSLNITTLQSLNSFLSMLSARANTLHTLPACGILMRQAWLFPFNYYQLNIESSECEERENIKKGRKVVTK